MNRLIFAAGLAIIVLKFSACDYSLNQVIAPEENSENVSISMKLAIPQNLQGMISRVEYVISADDMEAMTGELSIGDDSIAKGTVTGIKAGEDRLFTLNAYGENGSISHTGSSIADISAGEITTVRIKMGPFTGTAEVIGEITEVPQSSGEEIGRTKLAYPFRFTLEKLEILEDDQVKFTISIANVTQDTTLFISAYASNTAINDNQGNSYTYSEGWSYSSDRTILPRSFSRVFVICESRTAIENPGTDFNVSVGYDFFAKASDGATLISSTRRTLRFSRIMPD